MLLVLNNLIKNLFITKSGDDNCVLFRKQAARPQRRKGMHLDFINCSVISSDASLPTA